MDKLHRYIQAITEAYPDLTIDNARLHNTDGQFNNLLIINEDLIFRFPRYVEGIKTLQNEVRILLQIQGRLPFPVPHPIFTRFDESTPAQNFIGYRMLPGTPLWRETLKQMADAPIWSLAEQLAHFLIALHSIPVEDLGSGLHIHDRLEEWIDLYEEFRRNLYPLMRPDACDAMSRHFETYLNDASLHTFQPALRHGDFGAGNLLFDPESHTLCGVIDFGFAGIGDPAIDIAAVSTLEPRLFTHFQKIYPDVVPLLRRAAFIQRNLSPSGGAPRPQKRRPGSLRKRHFRLSLTGINVYPLSSSVCIFPCRTNKSLNTAICAQCSRLCA
jgi:aminoglycoside 2''-phosphotransferase